MPRTINDIIPPSRRRRSEEAPSFDIAPAPPPVAPPPSRRGMQQSRPRPHKRFPWGTALIALVVVGLSIGALYAFSGAKVEIVPTSSTAPVSGAYTAMPSSGTLPFALVNVQKIASESVPAENTSVAADAAQGTITVYNTQAKPQALIKNTRFQSPGGLIFRTHESVTAPAAKGTTPGTVAVAVYADSAGETYNIGPTTFSLPGLSGTSQAGKVYAKSTTAITGGFTGKRSTVSQATDDAEHLKLKSSLGSGIADEVAPKVPDGYVLVPGSVVTTYTSLPDSAGDNGGVLVKEQATATAVVFPADALAAVIAGQIIGQEYSGQPVMLRSVSGLTLTPSGTAAPTGNAPFSFTLSGNATIVWKVDGMKIAGAVAGKSRASAQSVLTGYPEISKAYLTLRPFWTSAFPSDPADITVTVDAP